MRKIKNINVMLRRLAVVATLTVAALQVHAQTEASRTGLTVTVPNGYANVMADDLRVQSTGGSVRWMRFWDGQEWKFNPHWESLSDSWKNLTGTKTADTTVGTSTTGGTSTTAGGSTPSQVLTAGGGGNDGCWVLVDEDWQPSAGTTVIGGIPQAGPMVPVRTTPFNRIMGEATAELDSYPPARRVSVDYAALCVGVMVAGGTYDLEAIRRQNELYLGDDGRYAFSNRAVLEKRAVRALPLVTSSTPYAALGTGQMTVAPIQIDKGFRWLDKSGDWIDYNTQGQVVAYGDKNDNTVWLQRDTDGVLRGVVDATGHVVYTLHYTGQLITEVRDYPVQGNGLDLPPRNVKYQYDSANRLTQVTDVRGNMLKYSYDGLNHLVKITDQEGREEKLAYSGDTVKQRIAPDGAVTDYVFEYDDANKQFASRTTGPETETGRMVEDYTHNRAGKLVRKLTNGRTDAEVRYDTGARMEIRTNGRGFTTKITRNEFDQIVQIDQEDGTTVKTNYSALNLQPVEQIDEAAVVTRYDYDAKGNRIRKTEAAGLPEQRVTEYEVNSLGQVTKATKKGRTEANGTVTPDAIWQIQYDALGQITKIVDPEGGGRQYTYDRAGNLVKAVDSLDNVISFEVDADGNLLKVTDALGHVRRLAYDKVGNVVSYIDARLKATQYAYDAMNRRTQVVNPLNGIYKTQYNGQGMPVIETDEDGRSTQLQYDNFLRLAKQIDGLGNVTQNSYQLADGSTSGTLGSLLGPTEIQFPTYTQRSRYDQRERPTSLTRLNPTDSGVEGLVDSFTYDNRGRIKTTTDANGKTRYLTYDVLGRIVQFTDSLGNSMYLRWDVRDNLIEYKDFKGNVTKYDYDRNDQLVKETLPLGQAATYSYDKAGQLVQAVDPNGNQVRYTYDAGHRRTKTELTAAGGSTPALTYTFQYDAESNVVSWNDGTYSSLLTYDDDGNLLREAVTYGGGALLSYEYSYTPAGNKASLKYPDGTTVAYGYDKHGELGQVDIPDEGTMSVNEWHWTMPKRTTLPGGTIRQQTYDGLLNLKTLTVINPKQQALVSITNSFGKVEELKQSSVTDSDGSSNNTVVRQYTYDDEKRLVQAKADTGGLLGVSTETFGLDAIGNRIAHSAVSGVWTYDTNNRLTQRGDTKYDYDASGNLIKRTVGTSGAANTITIFKYDALNRLIEVQDGTGNTVAKYAYDPFDNRLAKDVYRDTGGNTLASPVRTLYLYADEGLIAEASANGDILTQYGWKPDGEWGTAPLFIKTNIGAGTDAHPGYAWLHNDRSGTAIRATNKDGQVVWRADLNSFGLATLAPENQLTNNLRFAGQYFDAETGLHYNTRRYYDPQTARYITADPIGLDGGPNRYAYVKGDPINRTDPTGEFLPLIIGAIEIGIELYEYYQWYEWIKDTYNDYQNGTLGCSGLPPVFPGKLPGFRPPKIKPPKKPPTNCGLGKNSFTADTLVHMRPQGANDDEAKQGKAVLKPISEIKVGDEVLAWSEWKQTEEAQSYEKVVDIISSYKEQRLVHILLENGQTITSTDGHPFSTSQGWRDAILLQPGDQLQLDAKTGNGRSVAVKSVWTESKTVPVFNLEVANAHTYFVGAAGILVHNGGKGEGGFRGGGKGQRDRDFGIKDKAFWKWWEKEKAQTGQSDLKTKEAAEEAFQDFLADCGGKKGRGRK